MPRPPASPSPPPASFPFTAGSFDYPQASSTPSSPPPPANRNVLRLADEPPQRASDPHSTLTAAIQRRLSARRRQMHRLLGPPRDSDLDDTWSRLSNPSRLRRTPNELESRWDRPPTANPIRAQDFLDVEMGRWNRPSTANPSRTRATPPSERYHAGWGSWRPAYSDSPTEPFDSLSEFPVMLHAATRPRSPVGDLASERRQTKRRKLEHDAKDSDYDSIKYGYKGQVVPGRLKMDIVSCDGGEYQKDNSAGLYNVHNVLKNDNSVYCSERSRCNLLLKHVGDAPFALEKIVIRAPNRGFTAPVQEGLIFVSMTPDELLAGTAAYQLQYSYSPSISPLSTSDEYMLLREAAEDPDLWQTARRVDPDNIEARIERLRVRTRMLNESSIRAEMARRRNQFTTVEDDVFGENCDDASYSAAAGVSAPTPPPFTITTTSEDDDSDSNEDLPSAAIIADRLHRESRWRPSSDDEDEPRYGPLRRALPLEYAPRDLRRRDRSEHIRAPRLGGPSRIHPSGEAAESGALIRPHARFFIAKNKNKITIKFHAAISGRNVLLKFWSPTYDGNIDIESVQLYGYSGPRFFPATQPC